MDILVTVPKSFTLAAWIAEGNCAGDPPEYDDEPEGDYYVFTIWGARPNIKPGERVYCCYNGHLIGYAPLLELQTQGNRHGLVRRGGAVAVTIARRIPGFRGFRYRDWEYSEEVPFPDWKKLALPAVKDSPLFAEV